MGTKKLLQKRIVALFILSAICALFPVKSVRANMSTDGFSQKTSFEVIDTYIEKQQDALNIPGASLAIVEGEGPEQVPAGIKPSVQNIALLLDQATNLWLEGRRDDAIKYLEQLLRDAPNDERVVKRVFGRLYQAYRATGRLDDAEKIVDDALAKRPEDKTLVARKRLLRETDPNTQFSVLMRHRHCRSAGAAGEISYPVPNCSELASKIFCA